MSAAPLQDRVTEGLGDLACLLGLAETLAIKARDEDCERSRWELHALVSAMCCYANTLHENIPSLQPAQQGGPS